MSEDAIRLAELLAGIEGRLGVIDARLDTVVGDLDELKLDVRAVREIETRLAVAETRINHPAGSASGAHEKPSVLTTGAARELRGGNRVPDYVWKAVAVLLLSLAGAFGGGMFVRSFFPALPAPAVTSAPAEVRVEGEPAPRGATAARRPANGQP